MDAYIDDLNPQQKEAIRKLDGPVLVIAGAGSGKTKTLTYRIAYLIKDKGVHPLNILAVTFTNKAANEMRERIYSLIGETDIPFLGTFHSICVRLLRRDGSVVGINPNFTIYDTNDALDAVKTAMETLHISAKEYSPHKVLGLISSCKNELITPENYLSIARMPIQEAAAQIYPVYRDILKNANAMDFDDLIMKTVQMFTYKEVLEKYQNMFKYILVDEYQDTNHAQYMLVRMLAQKYRNIFCVGDPDQNIYTFRGATLDNILNFEKDYPEASIVMLEQNYRSTKNILKAAHLVISKNERRKEKEMWTENFEGERIKRYIATNEQDEAYFIVRKVKEKADYSQCVVLYRTNAQSRALEEVFLQENIPYTLVGGLRFYDRKEIKDILAYLKVLYNPKDNVSLKRIINTPPRKIGKKTIDDLEDAANAKSIPLIEYMLNNKENLPPSVLKFAVLIEYLFSLIAMSEISLSHFITLIINKIDYVTYLEQEDETSEMRVENIQELNSVASRYDAQSLGSALEGFLENVALVEKSSNNFDEDTKAVTFMSVHSAKGLEFDTVFVIGMEEGLFPHANSMYDMEQLEEERRLCYVAMTRAKKELFLINAETRMIFGNTQASPASRFIRDIPDYLIAMQQKYAGYSTTMQDEFGTDFTPHQFEKGDYVFHPTFQNGVVIATGKDDVTVVFEQYGTKKLLLSFVQGMTKVQY